MVGVPGRSKGCNTCIQRKVKCDGGQPTCGNCRKSNRLCAGYRRPVAFVMSSNVALGPAGVDDAEVGAVTTHGRWRRRPRQALRPLEVQQPVQTAAAASPGVMPPQPAPPPTRGRPIDGIDLLSTATKSEIKASRRRYIYEDDSGGGNSSGSSGSSPSKARGPTTPTSAAATVAALSQTIAGLETRAAQAADGSSSSSWAAATTAPWLPPPVRSEAVWREQLYPLFLSYHLPRELLRSCTAPGGRGRNWLVRLADAPLAGSPVLETAMAALCMARVGRKHGHAPLVQHSLRLYTQGLRQLQDAVQDPATRLADQTLAACTAFSMYEVSECPAGHVNAYFAHHTGGLALLKMRGPDAHVSPLGHALFVFMRVQQFIYALLMRKANFLSDPAWLRRPWQATAKDPQDRFMDQMYCIPVLLEQTDALAAAEAAGTDADAAALVRGYWGLVGQYRAIDRCLQGWFRDLQASVAGPLYWPEMSQLRCPVFDGTARGRPFPVAFHFPAFSVGQVTVLWWLIELMVHHQLAKIYAHLVRLQTARGASSSPGSGSGSGSAGSTPTPTLTPTDDPIPAVARLQADGDEAAAVARTTANNLCQSVEFFLQESMGDVGPLSALLPLSVLAHVVARMPSARPCPPGHPDRPGEFSDEAVWVGFLIQSVGGRGQQLAYYMTDD